MVDLIGQTIAVKDNCTIDWIYKKGKSPEKAGIYDKDKNLLREVNYNKGVYMEDYFQCKLSELKVTVEIKRLNGGEYTFYNIENDKDQCITFEHYSKLY